MEGNRRTRELRPGGAVAGLLACSLAAPALLAHDLGVTRTRVRLEPDGRYAIEMICDLDALALGVSASVDSAELAAALASLSPEEREEKVEGLKRLFERRVRVLFDGGPVAPERVEFPEHGTGSPGGGAEPSVLGLVARLTGAVPPQAESFAFRASRAFPPVHLSVEGAGGVSLFEGILPQGAASDPISLDAPAPAARGAAFRRYLMLGFWHIVPEGLDHILFVLGLVLLSPRVAPLLWQVSAFTLAHTLTLGLSSLGWVSLPPSVVEPLIALSIAYVALENTAVRELKPWRPVLVFAFGLLHGLGFAGVLGEIGLPEGERLLALLAFNLGVEAGQLAVIAGALLAIGWARGRRWYRERVSVPLSAAIALAGIYWAVERALGA